MSSRMTASEAELLKLAAIVTADREDGPGEGLPLSLLSDLVDQIRCDCISFCGHDSQRQEYWFSQGLPDDDEDLSPGPAGGREARPLAALLGLSDLQLP
jgi:hypothetical protein